MRARLVLFVVMLAIPAGATVHAEEPPAGPVLVAPQAATPAIVETPDLVTSLVLKVLPEKYVDDDDWGKTKSRWDGLKVEVDGLRIKTKRRKKRVNHGDWQRYTITLDDRQPFRVRGDNLRQAEDGRLAIDIVIDAPLHLHGRHAQWVKGVQLFSVEAIATAHVHLEIKALIGIRFGGTRFTPAVELLPEVTDANMRVTQFKLHRVSNLRGEFADELGNGLREIVEDEAQLKPTKLAAKINRQIKKNQHHLKLSVSELVDSQLSGLVEQNDD